MLMVITKMDESKENLLFPDQISNCRSLRKRRQYYHRSTPDVVPVLTMRDLFMEDIVIQRIVISLHHTHLIHLVIILITVTHIIRHIQVIHHIIHRTLTCIRTKRAFTKVLIRMSEIKTCETLETVKGKYEASF